MVTKPEMWVSAGGSGRHPPTWRDAERDFTLALEERDIPASLSYWCSWEPLGRCLKHGGREHVGFQTLHKQDGRSGRCWAPGAQRRVCARRWGWWCPAHQGSAAGSGQLRLWGAERTVPSCHWERSMWHPRGRR